MTRPLDSRKYRLIQAIMDMEDEKKLAKFEALIATDTDAELLEKMMQPTRLNVTVAELVKEQNYQPIPREEFYKLADELDIQEPIEHLLNMLD